MKRVAQPALSREGKQAFDQYTHALQQMEDLSTVTISNYMSDLCQFMAWCEAGFRQEQSRQFFTPQAIAPFLLIGWLPDLFTNLNKALYSYTLF